jgi:gamma-butyrobetaine dioxygenase
VTFDRPPAATVDEVLALYARFGGETYDEVVTQSSHARQCAELTAAAGGPPTAVAAALLHDVGHLLALADGHRDRRHEDVGVRWLAGLFGAEVLDPIRLHVEAKRYLCATDPGYRRRLSAGSERSLAGQGGPLTDAGVAAFTAHPGRAAAVALRRMDDEAKDLTAAPAPMDTWRDLLLDVSVAGPGAAARPA